MTKKQNRKEKYPECLEMSGYQLERKNKKIFLSFPKPVSFELKFFEDLFKSILKHAQKLKDNQILVGITIFYSKRN